MRLRPRLLVAGVMAALAAPVSVFADPPSTPATSTTTAAAAPKAKPPRPKPDPNQVICKDETPTGSHIGASRHCMTRAEWDDLAQQTASRLNDTIQREDYTTPTKGLAPP